MYLGNAVPFLKDCPSLFYTVDVSLYRRVRPVVAVFGWKKFVMLLGFSLPSHLTREKT